MEKQKHVFVGRVLHNGKEFLKGHLCPEDLHEHMLSIGVIAPIPAPIVAVEPPKSAAGPKPGNPSDKKEE